MKSILSLVAGSVLFGASQVAAYGASNPGALVYKGCYSKSDGLSLNSTYTFNTQGYCQKQCAPLGYLTLATAASTDCYCGNELPPASSLVSDSKCDAPCAGFGTDSCGSASGYYSVWLSGVAVSASAAPDSSSSATPTSTAGSSGTSQTTSSKPSVVTQPGSTIVVTAPPDSAASTSTAAKAASSGGGPNKAGIAAGVVVGIVALAAIAGGIFLFVRNKKRRAVEDEYRRNAAVSSFVGSGKPPTSSSGDSAFTDTRLDPSVMAQRRMSDGSIADNQDYSRRILKVTNA